MKNLLYLTNLRLPTEKAYGIQITEMCSAFVAAGIKVKLLHPYRKNPLRDIFAYYNVNENFETKIIHVPDFYATGFLDRWITQVKNFISAVVLSIYGLFSDAEIIYSRDEMPLYLLSFFKKNLVFEIHKFSEARRSFYNRFKRSDLKIVAISESLKNKLLEFGFKKENILVAHDAVDFDKFNLDVQKGEARERVGLPQDGRIIMYTGHLFGWKGVKILAEAAKMIPEANFIFVGGTDSDRDNFEKEFGKIYNISILGRKKHQEIPLFLKAADILVLPNSANEDIYADTSPLKLFEYMASGRPIVASKLPGISEILNDGNSVLVQPGSVEDLSSAIKDLLSDSYKSEKISENAKISVKDYTWINRADKIIKFLV